MLVLGCGALGLVPGIASAAPFGAIAQLPGTSGCFEPSGFNTADNCASGVGLDEASGVFVSPDGKNVYVSAQNNGGAVLIFSRDPATGALTQLAGKAGCIATSNAACTVGRALGGAQQVVVSPDGKNVYVTGSEARGVAEFTRDANTGALTQPSGLAGCIVTDPLASGNAGCATGRMFGDVRGIAISPDGNTVYTAAQDNDSGGTGGGIAVLKRDSAGVLSQSTGTDGCVADNVTASPNCAQGRTLLEPDSVLVSPDGKNVYVAASEGGTSGTSIIDTNGAVDSFSRDATTGAITQLAGAAGCINSSGNDGSGAGSCATSRGKALHDADGSAITADGKSYYVAAQGINAGTGPGALNAFSRNPSTGVLMQLPGTAGCFSEDGTDGFTGATSAGTCGVAKGMLEPSGVEVSPDGRSVYAATSDGLSSDGPSTNAGAVAVFARASSDGSITPLASPDGCHISGVIYDASCTTDRALEGSNHLAMSLDCTSIYGASQDAGNQTLQASSYGGGALAAFSRSACSRPSSAARIPACSPTGIVSVSVTDSVGTTGAKVVHYRIDGGAEQTVATPAGNPSAANVAVPNGTHTLEYWGEDEYANRETQHHTASVTVDTVNGCKPLIAKAPGTIRVAGISRRACIASAALARITVNDASPVVKVIVTIDGHRVLTTTKTSFTVKVVVGKLRAGKHKLTITAFEASGKQVVKTVSFTPCKRPKPKPKPPIPKFTG